MITKNGEMDPTIAALVTSVKRAGLLTAVDSKTGRGMVSRCE